MSACERAAGAAALQVLLSVAGAALIGATYQSFRALLAAMIGAAPIIQQGPLIVEEAEEEVITVVDDMLANFGRLARRISHRVGAGRQSIP